MLIHCIQTRQFNKFPLNAGVEIDFIKIFQMWSFPFKNVCLRYFLPSWIAPSLARPGLGRRVWLQVASFSLAPSEPGQVAWRAEREQRRGEAQSDLDTESGNTERVARDQESELNMWSQLENMNRGSLWHVSDHRVTIELRAVGWWVMSTSWVTCRPASHKSHLQIS